MYWLIYKIEKSALWGLSIILAIICSVFLPPIGVILEWNQGVIIVVLMITNLQFALDIIFKLYLRHKKYLFSLEFLIDITAILSGMIEILILLLLYGGPAVANLRILRSFKLIGRMGQITRIGRIARIGSILHRFGALRAQRKKQDSRFIIEVSSKIQNVILVLMGYITIRYGTPPESYTLQEKAWFDIRFISEVVLIMIAIGGILQYYVQKTVSYPLVNLWMWLRKKLLTYDFLETIFATLEKESKKKDTTELTLFKLCFEDFFEKIGYLSEDAKQFLAGKFTPSRQGRIIFVSNIEGFTKLTAHKEPVEIDAMMRTYFTTLTNIVIEHNARRMEYIGDTLICYWDDAESADDALLASRKITEKTDLLPTRMGLHFGPVTQTLIVEMKERIQSNNFGDPIIMATRLEVQNKITKTKILMSKIFYDQLSPEMQSVCMSYGHFFPKGSDQQIEIYSLK